MAGRIIFQVDLAKSEIQIICRHQQECNHDSDLDFAVCLFASEHSQVPVKATEKHATNCTNIAAQSVF